MRKIFALILVLFWAGCAGAFPPPLPSSGSTTTMATDTIWDAAGDLAYGTGANTGGRLAIGTAYQLLMTNAGATAPAWTSTLGATGTRLTKGWFADLEITAIPSVNGVAGNATNGLMTNLMTGAGDMLYGGASGVTTRLAAGTDGYILQAKGAAAPQWVNSLSGLSFDIGTPGDAGAGQAVVVTSAGVLAFVSDALLPDANDGASLGNASYLWSDLYITSGGSLFFGAEDLTVTAGTNTVTLASSTGVTDIKTALNLVSSGTITGRVPAIVITSAEGAQDGGDDAAILTDSGETWGTNTYVGMTLYNVTDVSSCVVTANTNTTMTCTLTGGTDNNWDDGDTWAVAPGPDQAGSMIYIGAATTILHPATVGYSACYYSTGANTIKVDPQSASMAIYLNGATVGDGDEIDSAGAAGDFICIHNQSATIGRTLGRSGTWTDGGAS